MQNPFTSAPMWPLQTIFHSYITATHKNESILIYTHNNPQNIPLTEGERKDDNNRFVFQRKESAALQLAGNDKYLHARPREGHATAALLSQTGILRR